MSESYQECIKRQTCGCRKCFSIHHYANGVLISSPAPLTIACKIVQLYAEEFGYDICDSWIAHKLGASLCITTKELSEVWRKELGIDA